MNTFLKYVTFSLVLLFGCAVCYLSNAKAATGSFGPGNVRLTAHNLSLVSNDGSVLAQLIYDYGVVRQWSAKTETEVCIFCHTPHNATTALQLWNKNLPDPASFLLYSSASLSNAARGTKKLPANSYSLLCLSCHDGKSAVNVVHNPGANNNPSSGTGDYIIELDTGGVVAKAFGNINLGATWYGSNIGGTTANRFAGNDLTNDHPIGFSYTAAVSEKPNDLFPYTDATSKGMRFFGATNTIECSTCHDPHKAYGYIGKNGPVYDLPPCLANPTLCGSPEYRPFLVMSNNASKMCLTCHNK